MAVIINAVGCTAAWQSACNFILVNGNGSNLIVEIEQPHILDHSQLNAIVEAGIASSRSISDVVNTIFPYKLANRNPTLSLLDLTALHTRLYARGKKLHKRNASLWGTYFLRFTCFGEKQTNQLLQIVNAISRRSRRYSACYIMHVSSVDTDNNTRALGNPCLQYVQFEECSGKVNLTAVYRNHDFVNKALGNYIGLTRLLEYVCSQTGYAVGRLTCHSIHYFIENKANLTAGLAKLNS